jgi:hypothetical protein
MRPRTYVAAALAGLATGCLGLRLELPAPGSWGGGSMSHGGQTGKLRTNYAIVHLTYDSRVYFVMLVDGSSGGRVSSGSSGGNGEFPTRDGRAEWNVRTRNGRTGRVTVAGQQFRLEDGALLLVSASAADLSVRQVNMDLDAFNEGNWSADDRVRRLAATNEEVAAFLKLCETPR